MDESCKTSKKACKNCSCGRAEMEEQGVKLTAEMIENPQSACGSVSGGWVGRWVGGCRMGQRAGLRRKQGTITRPFSSLQCGLGDAFRCASCPYRGLPAFEQGKKIQIGADLLTADV